MLNISDLVVVEVLKQGLKFLADNPSHAEYILCGFEGISPIRKLVGPEYIKQAVEFFKNRVYVAPYYEYDIKRTPSIVVASSGGEGTQFLGDYGSSAAGPIYCKPRVYAKWDATAIDTTNNTMLVSSSYGLDTKLWNNVIITDGTQTLRLDGILARDGQDTKLYFKSPIVNTTLKGWSAQSDQPQTGYEISSSIDRVNITCKINTVGDASLMRLLQLACRYILKSRRLLLDSYGIKCATINYTEIMMLDQEEQLYESVVTLSAQAPESWISAEYPYRDSAARVDVQVEIIPEFPSPDKDSFLVEGFPSANKITPE